MSDKIYTNNPSPATIGRINFDVQQIKKEEDVIANEGIYFKFDRKRCKHSISSINNWAKIVVLSRRILCI